MTTQELVIVTELRNAMEKVLSESAERTRSLQRIQRIVERLEQETAALKARISLLERPHARI